MISSNKQRKTNIVASYYTKKFPKIPIALVTLLGIFLYGAPSVQAALVFPTTPCDFRLADPASHSFQAAVPEDGQTLFTYGPDNHSFVSRSGDWLTFRFNLRLSPDFPTAYLRLVGLHESCGIVLGQAFANFYLVLDGENTLSFNLETYDVQFNGLSGDLNPPGASRYFWIEVVDSYPFHSNTQSTYSYLVDAQDPQNPTGSPDGEPSGPTPVLIIPGITGTELYNGNDLIWPDLEQMFWDVNDEFLTENLRMDEQGNSVRLIAPGSVKTNYQFLKFEIDIFNGLVNSLEEVGYEEDKSIVYFPYDWRLDLEETKSRLNQKIEAIKQQTGHSKVDIIAHSMGGLLAKSYLNQYGKDSVRKLVFVGTPHLGAPKAGKILLAGDQLNIPWLEEDTVKALALNLPSLHELLPNQTYFDSFQGYLKKYSFFGSPPLLDYQQTQDFFLSEKGKNPVMFQKAEDFFAQDLQNFDFSGLEVYNLAGCKNGTQATYSLALGNNVIGAIGYTSGDGTVPLASADYINNLPNQNKFYVKNTIHAELPSADGVRELLAGILQDSSPASHSNVSNNPAFCNLRGKVLSWHSPVAVHIYDQQGNHAGPVDNHGTESGIPGVDYEISGHNKFIFLPTEEGQQYQIMAYGLDQGTFDLRISEIDDGQYLTTQVFNDVPVNPAATVSFDVNNESADNQIILEESGNTTAVLASATLQGDQALDLTPPQTQASIRGTEGTHGWYTSDVTVDLEANDDNSGILETRYSLDHGQTFPTYIQPLLLNTEGVHNLLYYSIDQAGNNGEIKNTEVNIDKTSPEISAEFDIAGKDFLFQSQDNLDPEPQQSCSGTACAVTDEAGNETILEFLKTHDNILNYLSLVGIGYNGNYSGFAGNALTVKYLEGREGLQDFDQTAFRDYSEALRINYHANKDQSDIFDFSSGAEQKHKAEGIKVLQVLTNKANLIINIK